MKEPAHTIQIHDKVFTGWPATAILAVCLLSFVAIGVSIGLAIGVQVGRPC
jgi:hypothetical protein